MAIDPQAKAYLERMAALGLPPTEEQLPQQARATAEERAPALFGPREDVHAVEDFEVEGVPVRLYGPSPTGAAAGSPRSTTGWRRSTGSRRRWTTAGPSRAGRSSSRRAWRWPATALEATWPP